MGKLPSQEYTPQTEVCGVSLGSSKNQMRIKKISISVLLVTWRTLPLLLHDC